ncbi:MAG TPA: fibronectin type III domain-containing protein [Acidimicrobiales bacterium]|nr:fibronectin type III domain-containing protein [Acidimicrobiales bacterium]
MRLRTRTNRRWLGAVIALVAGAGTIASISPAKALGPPSTPQGVWVQPYNWHSVDVHWNAGAADITSYRIEVWLGLTSKATATCNTPCTSKRVDSANLTGSTVYSVKVWAHNSFGDSLLPGTATSQQTPPTGSPDPPTAVSISASPTAPTITASWTLAATGNAATYVVISARTGGSQQEWAKCYLAPAIVHTCNGNTVTIPGLTPGVQYTVAMWAGNASGDGMATNSNTATLATGCAAGTQYCLAVNGTTTLRTATGTASGLLNATGDEGSVPVVNQTRVQALRPANWRLALDEKPNTDPPDFFDKAYAAAMTTNASITLLISDAWFAHSATEGSRATPPWNNWTAYTDWLETYVANVVDYIGDHPGWRQPDYWDIANEPDDWSFGGENAYFSAADGPSATVANIEEFFNRAYAVIKGVNANLKVLGPSVDLFATSPAEGRPGTLDLGTFLDYSASHALKWDAISWHENTAYKRPPDWTDNPEESITNHVAAVNTLLDQHPSLLSPRPALIINEYGPPDRTVVPGWQAGEIAAIEANVANGVTQANRSCFHSMNHADDDTGMNCFEVYPTLDGYLSASDGASTYPAYWVSKAYADMTYDGGPASVVASSSSHPSIGVFATANATTSTLNILIGRHVSCYGAQAGWNADCGAWSPPGQPVAVPPTGSPPAITPPAAVGVPLTFTFPYGASNGVVDVDYRRIAMNNGETAISEPAWQALSSPTLVNGTVTVTLPTVADGESLVIRVRVHSS